MQRIESPYSSWLARLGIKGVLTDLDDTLTQNGPVFLHFIDLVFALYQQHAPDVNSQLLYDTFHRINIELRKTYAVNPMVWEKVIEELHKELPLPSELALPAIELLAQIYVTVPELEDGAEELLIATKEAGIPVTVVTHANKKWTDFKLAQTVIGQYVDDVVIHDENDPQKNKVTWQKGLRRQRLMGKFALALGDNIQGDIKASHEAGIEHRVWFDQKNGWSPTKVGEVPPQTYVIKSLRDLLLGKQQRTP